MKSVITRNASEVRAVNAAVAVARSAFVRLSAGRVSSKFSLALYQLERRGAGLGGKIVTASQFIADVRGLIARAA